MYFDSFLSPIGYILVFANEEFIIRIEFSEFQISSNPNSITNSCITELQEYFKGSRKTFTIPYTIRVSSFTDQVLTACNAIEYGNISTYGTLASKIGKSNSSIAVGNALHKNPIPIIIPCHRILNVKHSNTGYSGDTWRKDFLLELEKKSLLSDIKCF